MRVSVHLRTSTSTRCRLFARTLHIHPESVSLTLSLVLGQELSALHAGLCPFQDLAECGETLHVTNHNLISFEALSEFHFANAYNEHEMQYSIVICPILHAQLRSKYKSLSACCMHVCLAALWVICLKHRLIQALWHLGREIRGSCQILSLRHQQHPCFEALQARIEPE